jgi:hypothetical protein
MLRVEYYDRGFCERKWTAEEELEEKAQRGSKPILIESLL